MRREISYLTGRIPPPLLDWLKLLAASNRRSANAELIVLLERERERNPTAQGVAK